tara:strand:+ start:541 stop:1215 length:675 start_codon:yes stop_codon:yes gene_type:complete
MQKRACTYIRASTSEELQPNSLEVQRAIVSSFAESNGYIIDTEFFEYASGTNDSRTEWNNALQYAEDHNAFIICWRVDRFSRSLTSFSKSNSLLSRLRFCELGDTEPNALVMSVLIAAGQNAALNTRVRIKETMRVLKERDGRVWGNPRITETAYPASLKVRQKNATDFNRYISEIVNDYKSAGYSLTECVSKLNNLGIRTRRSKSWTYHLLRRVINYNKGELV